MSVEVTSPFFIGKLELTNRLIQGPLAGISCAPFRELFSLYTKPAYAVTEMISAKSIIENSPAITRRYLSKSSDEGLLCIQLSGNNAETLAKAVKICESFKPDLIDLNCGCPKPKIRSKGAGSGLLSAPNKLREIISAMREATNLPLTAKIRTAGNTDDDSYLEAASIIATEGFDAIIVHGRHFSEDYMVKSNYLQIKKIVDLVKIPVIANGDIHDLLSMHSALNISGADAVMIGRGSIGKPWLFKELLAGSPQPTFSQRVDIFRNHIESLINLEANETRALLQARRLLKWYFQELSKNELEKFYQQKSLINILTLLREISI